MLPVFYVIIIITTTTIKWALCLQGFQVILLFSNKKGRMVQEGVLNFYSLFICGEVCVYKMYVLVYISLCVYAKIRGGHSIFLACSVSLHLYSFSAGVVGTSRHTWIQYQMGVRNLNLNSGTHDCTVNSYLLSHFVRALPHEGLFPTQRPQTPLK